MGAALGALLGVDAQGAHAKRPREVVESAVMWSVLLMVAAAVALVALG